MQDFLVGRSYKRTIAEDGSTMWGVQGMFQGKILKKTA